MTCFAGVRSRLISCILGIPLLGACAETAQPVDDAVARLTVVNPGYVAVKQRVTLQVLAYDRSGERVPPPAVRWTSSDESILSVDTAGVVTGLSMGAAFVHARSGDVNGSMRIDVEPAAVRVVFAPAQQSIAVGDSAVVTATLIDFEGDVIAGDYSFYWECWPENTLIFSRKPQMSVSQFQVVAADTGLTAILAMYRTARGGLAVRVVPATRTSSTRSFP